MSVSESDIIKIRQRMDRLERNGGFVPRPFPIPWDKSLADINALAPNTWNDLNLASVIPGGTKAILVRSILTKHVDKYSGANPGLAMTSKTSTNGTDGVAIYIPTIDVSLDLQSIVLTDGLQVVRWQLLAGQLSGFYLAVLGWWK
jgi:hypothetical protein